MNILETLGRLHPLAVHFPIALILVAAIVETVRIKWERPFLAQLVPFLMGLGAIVALAATVTGWIFAREHHPMPSQRAILEWHRWLGLATTLLAGLSAGAALRFANTQNCRARWMRRTSVWLTAAALTVAAHLGALMVWGTDYFDPSQ